jgi:hypothetical protein
LTVADEHDATGTTDDATGTTAQAADGSAAAADGSEVEALRAKLADEERKNAQLLSEKTRVEEAQREIEWQRAGAYQSPSPMGAPDQTAEIAREIRERAEAGDATAIGLIVMAQSREQDRQQAERREKKRADDAELELVPANDRAETTAEYATGSYWTPAAAYNAVLGKRYRKDQEGAAERQRKETEAARRRADDAAVDTVARGTPPPAEGSGRSMEWADYVRQLQSLPRDKALKLKQDADRGLISVKQPTGS